MSITCKDGFRDVLLSMVWITVDRNAGEGAAIFATPMFRNLLKGFKYDVLFITLKFTCLFFDISAISMHLLYLKSGKPSSLKLRRYWNAPVTFLD
jgi:hypothetical protein